jgi:alpha-mannosidase
VRRVSSRRWSATYEIQYGHVERPTHRNTSWDTARFEVCAHKWVDVSEPGYGVALLNDCKYGHDVDGTVLRLSLLRAPVSPDPTMDRGSHHFTYSLFPHVGDFREAGVVEEGYALNLPLRIVPLPADRAVAASAPHTWGAFRVAGDGVFIESIKRAERSDDVIVRLYEAWGRRTSVTVETALPVEQVQRTDLLEREVDAPFTFDGGTVGLDLRPFELVTLRYKL